MVLNISSLVKDSSYFAYIVTNSIGCVHLLEENTETECTFSDFEKLTKSNWKLPNSGLQDQLFLSKVHNRVVVWQLFVCCRVPFLKKGSVFTQAFLLPLGKGVCTRMKEQYLALQNGLLLEGDQPLLFWDSFSLLEKQWN